MVWLCVISTSEQCLCRCLIHIFHTKFVHTGSDVFRPVENHCSCTSTMATENREKKKNYPSVFGLIRKPLMRMRYLVVAVCVCGCKQGFRLRMSKISCSFVLYAQFYSEFVVSFNTSFMEFNVGWFVFISTKEVIQIENHNSCQRMKHLVVIMTSRRKSYICTDPY